MFILRFSNALHCPQTHSFLVFFAAASFSSPPSQRAANSTKATLVLSAPA